MPPVDPYLWLEDVQGDRALAWARDRNAQSQVLLEAVPGFPDTKPKLLAVLNNKAQVPYVSRRGAYLENFWRDATHKRGLWRRTTLDEYRKAEPKWETLIDLDALALAEKENWVWTGADCLAPDYTRCMVSLSRGGADATVVREFDLAKREFVQGGFALPEAKSQVDWLDADTVLVGTDFG
ncbi:MAG: S9 family peptidase, partial [Ferruginibacter sp.]|nr:S9 family peptidase [Rhodoferax sp.]